MIRRLIILLLIVGCDKIAKKEVNNSYLEFWEIKYFVNQNYEPTDVGYITNANPIIGEFSTLKILNNTLKVKIMIKERAVGIKLESITLDPGFGFGKNLAHNIALLKNLAEFHDFGVSILAGLSRKSMIGSLLGDKEVDSRMIGSVTAALIAVENGANIIRAHDVAETKDALTVWQQIKHFRE